VLVAMLALGISLGAQAKKPPLVGISTGSSGTSWRTIMIDALEMVGKEYKAAGKIKDYKLVNNVTNGDATEQANILRDFISQGVDIILVNPNSPDALNGVIKEAQDEGILGLLTRP
jgi:ribose transport system substrate-binding protein